MSILRTLRPRFRDRQLLCGGRVPGLGWQPFNREACCSLFLFSAGEEGGGLSCRKQSIPEKKFPFLTALLYISWRQFLLILSLAELSLGIRVLLRGEAFPMHCISDGELWPRSWLSVDFHVVFDLSELSIRLPAPLWGFLKCLRGPHINC